MFCLVLLVVLSVTKIIKNLQMVFREIVGRNKKKGRQKLISFGGDLDPNLKMGFFFIAYL